MSDTSQRPDRTALIATGSQTIGPFFHFGPGSHLELGQMSVAGTAGELLRLAFRVFDGQGLPVPEALIEIWQADGSGRYPTRTPGQAPTGFPGFGRMPTDEAGMCTFDTIRPGRVSATDAAHVNVLIFMRGLLRHVYTRLYFAGDPDLASDQVLALVPQDRRSTLCASPAASGGGEWIFEIHMQGDRETVFFDL